MSRYLLIDIGAGTMDILWIDDESRQQFKAVVKSPVRTIAERAGAVDGDLFVTGCEMGGGAVSAVLKKRAEDHDVVMTASAAATVHHHPETVKSFGIRVVDDDVSASGIDPQKYGLLTVGDIEPDRIRSIVEGFGVPFDVDIVGICAQDHGVPPAGVSHLDFRHNLFAEVLDKDPRPEAMVYHADEIPDSFNRLKAIARSARELPADEIYVMDSGMAAIAGASTDLRAAGKKHFIVLDIATSHTVGAAVYESELAGFFEYHTHDITCERLDRLLVDLADGRLDHGQILFEGGHGAYIRKGHGFDTVECIISTGPKRSLAADSRLAMEPGAPMGDNMMTGTAGLLKAIRQRR